MALTVDITNGNFCLFRSLSNSVCIFFWHMLTIYIQTDCAVHGACIYIYIGKLACCKLCDGAFSGSCRTINCDVKTHLFVSFSFYDSSARRFGEVFVTLFTYLYNTIPHQTSRGPCKLQVVASCEGINI